MTVHLLVTNSDGTRDRAVVLDDGGPEGAVRIVEGAGTQLAEGLLNISIIVDGGQRRVTAEEDPAEWLRSLPGHFNGHRLRAAIV